MEVVPPTNMEGIDIFELTDSEMRRFYEGIREKIFQAGGVEFAVTGAAVLAYVLAAIWLWVAVIHDVAVAVNIWLAINISQYIATF